MVLTFMEERRRKLEKARAEGRAEGYAIGLAEARAEGIAEVHAKWSAWNRRREDAARRGERFDEPPPPA